MIFDVNLHSLNAMIFRQKVQKSLKRVLEAESISSIARKREPDGHIPDTPPDSAFQGLLPNADPLMAILVGGGETGRILSVGRLIKIFD